ncbi:porin family protein [Halomonas sediminis]
MKKEIYAFMLLGMISSPAFGEAAGTSYAGLQYAKINYEDVYGGETEPSAVIGRVGHFANNYFAIEVRAGMGLDDDDVEWNGYRTDVTVELDYLYGVYGVGHLPLTDMLSVYALIGYTGAEATAELYSMSESDTDSDFSYGLGGQVQFNPIVSGTIEYVSYLDKSEFEVTALSAGLNFKF